MDDYLLYYKRRLPLTEEWDLDWDVFISAYNPSDRIRLVSERVRANETHWLLLPEYRLTHDELPADGNVFSTKADSEAELISDLVASISEISDQRIAIDITGLMNQYVLVLLAVLRRAGISECDLLYSEPVRYLQSERTRFSDEAVISVRQVEGFEGVHTTDTSNDLLIIAVGYDYRLVAEVANAKEHTAKIQLFGLPSLRPDMYQESLLRASLVEEAIGPEGSSPSRFIFAPAYDPFVTASVLSTTAAQHRSRHPQANLYLSPLSTKAQALGFAIFYLSECVETPTSVVYPFCRTYMKETSEGLSGVWIYHLELAAAPSPAP